MRLTCSHWWSKSRATSSPRAEERNKFRAKLLTFAQASGELGIRQALTEAGLTGAKLEESVRRIYSLPGVTGAIQDDSVRIASQISASARKHLRNSLVEGLEGGEGYDQLADRIQEFTGQSHRNALNTARNVVAQTLSMTRHETFRETGMTHELWVHSRAPGQWREAHVEAEGYYAKNPKPLAEPFVINGFHMRFPRDPSAPAGETINCQCMAIAERITEGEAASARDMIRRALGRGFVQFGSYKSVA
jgi:hypothetical protein